jgi:hypothetical protein
LLVGLNRDADYWVYLGIPMQGNRLIKELKQSVLKPREL